MKPHFLLILALLLSISQISYSQKVYTFTGTGSWKVAANWLNNAIPPTNLASGDSIIIDPNGECILDAVLSVSNGVKLVVRPGKKFTIANNPVEITDSTFADPRDGQKYPFKTIGTQVWMTKNLNYEVPGSLCYDDNAANCAIYGRLYYWNTALTVAPPGWHLPTDAEWTTLINYLGGIYEAGGAMKSTDLWNSPNTGATNSSGFAGLPGGYLNTDGIYFGLGDAGNWWSSTEFYTDIAGRYYVSNQNAYATRSYDYKIFRFSVRCVRD